MFSIHVDVEFLKEQSSEVILCGGGKRTSLETENKILRHKNNDKIKNNPFVYKNFQIQWMHFLDLDILNPNFSTQLKGQH